MRVPTMLFFVLLSNCHLCSQFISTQSDSVHVVKWLDGGYVDYLDGGLLQTSLGLLQINLGEPERFNLPVYFMVGTTTDLSTVKSKNEIASANLLTPFGGSVNVGINGKYRFGLKTDSLRKHKFSQVSFTYHLGFKSILAENEETKNSMNISTAFTNLGFKLQTAAWDKWNSSIIGSSWLQLAFTTLYPEMEKVKAVFGKSRNPFYLGYSLQGGIKIEKLIDLNFGYFKQFNRSTPFKDHEKGLFVLSAVIQR